MQRQQCALVELHHALGVAATVGLLAFERQHQGQFNHTPCIYYSVYLCAIDRNAVHAHSVCGQRNAVVQCDGIFDHDRFHTHDSVHYHYGVVYHSGQFAHFVPRRDEQRFTIVQTALFELRVHTHYLALTDIEIASDAIETDTFFHFVSINYFSVDGIQRVVQQLLRLYGNKEQAKSQDDIRSTFHIYVFE